MTTPALPTHDELAAQIKLFQREAVNSQACDKDQTTDLEKFVSTPPKNFTILKDGSRALVGKHTLLDGTECALKYYYPKNLAKKINYGLRGSRCMRSWIAARVFELLGIPTAASMMIHEKKGAAGIILKQSFFACRLAPGIPLSDVTDEAAFQKIAPQLEKIFTTMATYRISHGDLKANNIIVDNHHNIRFIDLDGTTILSPEKTWTKLWQRDRKRFLRNWPKDSLAHQLFSETIPRS